MGFCRRLPTNKGSPGARSGLGIAVITAGAIVSWAVPVGHAAEACKPVVARIVSLQGRVEVQSAGSAEWTPATLDDQLCVGDAIRAGAFARAALALTNDSVLSLDQLTTMRLGGEAETGRSLLDLLLGEVHFFSHRPRSLEIVTPIANAGTEGTEFLMRARPDRTEVIMFEGRVRLQTPVGELLLASGDAAVAVAGAAPQPEIVARPRDAVAWSLYYPPILAPLAERHAAPGTLPPALQQAVERVAANDYAGAIAALDAVPEAARDARYYTFRAGVLLNVGRADEAAQAIDRALALDPKAADALAQRAVIAVVQNRRDDALKDARRAVELNPDSAPARIALSYAQQASFDLEAARATLREAAERTPDDALVQARRAEIELSFGDLNAAEAAAAQAVTLAPELARTQMVLGFAALTRIDIKQAKAAFEHAIELDSAEPLARLGLGLATIRAGDLKAGRRELEIATALDPNNSLLRSYLGKAYFEEKRGPQDADQFQIAKQLDPNDPTPWFYDAIRLQTENRPVEALRDLETSITLNDNRAPYRSRLLLDQDLAVRQVSLARIYGNLGFDQLGLNEATRSLHLDPANYSAHRFLADTYAALPRYEIARVSELLQAQLLQPINVTPLQPRLSFSDLNLEGASGPAEPAFNEYTPLFARNGLTASTTGAIGNQDTWADEVIVSGLWNKLSASAGQFHYDTNGFRDNNDLTHDVYDIFVQAAVTPTLNLQAEYRRRATDHGDRALNFDPEAFSPSERRRINENVFRFGSHLAISPQSDLLLSGIYSNRQPRVSFNDVLPAFDDSPATTFELTDESSVASYETEGQYLFTAGATSLVIGAGTYNIDESDSLTQDLTPCPSGDCATRTRTKGRTDAANGYAYWLQRLSPTITGTVGLGYEAFDQDGSSINEPTPKLGLEWAPFTRLRVRIAAFRTVKRTLVADQTLEPTQVAGFNQFFEDVNGTKADRVAGAVDMQITPTLFIGVEASRRNTSPPKFETIDGHTEMLTLDQEEDMVNSYIYWILTNRIAMTSGMDYEEFRQTDQDAGPNPTQIHTLLIPTGVRYFDPWGWFAGIGCTYLDQSVERAADATGSVGDNHALIFDAMLGYRLPRRVGMATIEVNNIFDSSFEYQDQSFRTPELLNQKLLPERTVLVRVSLNF